jgi:hypothetical protein
LAASPTRRLQEVIVFVRRRTARSALVLAALLPALLLPAAAGAMPLEPPGTEAAMPAVPVDLRSADAIAAEIEADRAATAPASPAVSDSPGMDWRLVVLGALLLLLALAAVTATRVRVIRRRVPVVA